MTDAVTLIEENLLGGLMLKPTMLDDIHGGDDLFFDDDRRLIFREMRETWTKRQSLDLPILAHDMHDHGTADKLTRGVHYLAELLVNCCTDPMPAHVDILRRHAAKREMQMAIDEATLAVSHGTDAVPDAAAKLRQALDGITDADDSSIYTMADLCNLEDIGPSRYIPTGFFDLDKVISGWMPGTLVLIAARPSVGKSALGLSLSVKAAQAGHAVAFVSSEMAKEQVRDRMLSNQSGIEHFAIKEGRVPSHDREIIQAKADLYELPFVIDDESRAYPMTARALVSKTQRKWGKCDLVVIDYLQRLAPDWKERGRNREQEVATIVRTLQQDARRLDVTIIALAQLNRRTALMGDGRPKLSDLRESGGLEADADVVLLMWIKESERKLDNMPVQIIVAKNRHGRCGNIVLMFDKDHQRFS